MISALFYLQFLSLKNRLLMRVRRLKQPKYLAGGIVGGLYFYFYFFRYLLGVGKSPGTLPLGGSAETIALFEGIGATLLMVMVVLGWVLPRERAALAFSEAEVAFLFPAPISRRGLIHYKLMRSQVAILFTSLFLVLLSSRMGGNAWVHAAGWWLILSTLNLHLLAASFARTMLLDRGISNWQRRAAVFLALLAFGGIVVVWARHSLPELNLAELTGIEQLKDYFRQLLTAGPIPWLLYPFRLVVRPYLAQTGTGFLMALLPALGILAAHYLWVLRSNVAFEEASVDASRKLAEKVAAVRSGNWQGANQALKGRRAPFVLRPNGAAAVGLLWKNLISAGQAYTWRIWLVLGILAASTSVAISQSAMRSNLASILGTLAGTFMIWTLLLGPQFLRQDFRQDMQLSDVLKMYPLRGWQIALGELLAPAVILSAIQWTLLLVTVLLFSGIKLPGLGRAEMVSISLGAAIISPMLNVLTLQIPNAAVLLFPAWFQSGKDGPQGIEATGQRIIFMLGQLLAFLVAMIPAAVAFSVLFFTLRLVLALPVVIVAASAAAALVVAAEAALGVLLLGKLFERFDVSAEQVS